ncbi:helix-turn-helix transcriptional regulator [Caenispirillum bisanense]|uniref:helix-turn-helix domain-containing protein n=1 Tax=Caenispirillum bisanense TaxID=414052 RepID=UPI0031E09EB8
MRQARIEDPEDILAARDASGGEALPLDYARRIIMDESHPVRVWREYRGLTVDALPERAGMEPGYVAEIETGDNVGSTTAYHQLAAALETTVVALVMRSKPDSI